MAVYRTAQAIEVDRRYQKNDAITNRPGHARLACDFVLAKLARFLAKLTETEV